MRPFGPLLSEPGTLDDAPEYAAAAWERRDPNDDDQ